MKQTKLLAVLALFLALVPIMATAQINATQTNADIDAGFDIIANLFEELTDIMPDFMSLVLTVGVYVALLGAILVLFGLPGVIVAMVYTMFRKVKINQ